MPLPVLYIAIAVLLIGILPLPYGYYTLLRIVATGAFVWAAITAHQKGERTLPWMFALSAVIYNPILPVYLTKGIWMILNLGGAAMLYLHRDKITEKEAGKAE